VWSSRSAEPTANFIPIGLFVGLMDASLGGTEPNTGERSRPRNDETPLGSGVSAKRLKRFELSTFCMASRRSSQLSYSRMNGTRYRLFVFLGAPARRVNVASRSPPVKCIGGKLWLLWHHESHAERSDRSGACGLAGRGNATTPKRQIRGRRPAAPVPCHTDAGLRRAAVGGTPSRLGRSIAGGPGRGVNGLRKSVIVIPDRVAGRRARR
jgi:hypothetical protein